MNTDKYSVAEVELSYKNNISIEKRERVRSSLSAEEILRKIYPEDKIDHKEMFYAIFLNPRGDYLGFIRLAEGGITSTTIDVRVLFQAALLSNATAMIVSHNHPSGGLIPSAEDIQVTQQIKDAGRILNIRLLDHLILTSEGYSSFADDGRL